MVMRRSGQQSYACVFASFVVFSVCATSITAQSVSSSSSNVTSVFVSSDVSGTVFSMETGVSSTPVSTSPVYSVVSDAVSMTASISGTPLIPSRNSTTFQESIELTEERFIAELLNETSKEFKNLSVEVSGALERSLKPWIVSIDLVGFSPGSVIATFNITTLSKDASSVKSKLIQELKDGHIGNFGALPTLISLPDAFEVVLKIKEKCVDDFLNKSSRLFVNFTSKVEKAVKENSKMAGNITDVEVKDVQCPADKAYTTVYILVQVSKSKSQIPDEELKDLKKEVEQGNVGGLQVVPKSWKAYKTGQIRKFVVSLKLTNDSVTDKDLQEAIKNVFGNASEYIYNSVEIKDGRATIEISMAPRTSPLPNEALTPLQKAVDTNKIGSIGVDGDSYKAWTPTPLNEKVYQVYFDYPFKNCVHATLHNRTVEERVANYTKKRFARNPLFKDVSSVELLECTPIAVHARVEITMDPSVPDDPSKLLDSFISCNNQNMGRSYRITLLTPTTADYSKPATATCPTVSPRSTSPTGLLTTSAPQKLPKLYVKMRLDMTWKEFCNRSLDQKLKEKIAENVHNKNGQRISPDQVVFFNKEKHCNDPMKRDEQVDLWFYVSPAPGSSKLARCLTRQAFKKLKKFLDTDSTSKLGSDFDGKVIDVKLGGCDASKFFTKDSGLSGLAIIVIAVLAGVTAFLLLLLLWCCCWFICCRRRRRRRKRKAQGLTALEVVPVVVTDGQGGLDEENKKKKDKKDKKKDKHNKKKKSGKDSDDDGKGDKKAKADLNGGGTGAVAYQNNAYDAGTADDGNVLQDDAQDKHEYATLGDTHKDANANLSGDGDVLSTVRTGPEGGTGSYTGSGNAIGTGSVTDGGGLMAPMIVTSPSSGSNDRQLSSPSTLGSARRGSSNLGDTDSRGSGSKPSSPLSPRCSSTDMGRRRSSAHSIDEAADPLTHKTATVGIVALALRNKNERKKDTEFKNLTQEMPVEGTYPASVDSKNRSPYILPEPKTRVKLSTNPDYINANYMRDHKGQTFYITTQHPLRESIDDYWRMVWDQKSTCIVMVNEEEKDKPKEFPSYLPNGEGSTKKFGSVDVTVKTVTTTADYVITTLAVSCGKANAVREVTHFHFTSWKGRGAMPNVGQFVAFVMAARKVAKKNQESKAPIIANCNTGQGFSGVYIALDIGIRSHQESKTSVVDVFEVAKKLRHDRKGIIATRDHYNFIYQALYEYTVNYDETSED